MIKLLNVCKAQLFCINAFNATQFFQLCSQSIANTNNFSKDFTNNTNISKSFNSLGTYQ